LRDKKRINEIMISLENLEFIQVHGDIFTPINKLRISITKKGIETIKSLESESVVLYSENISINIKNYPYGSMEGEFKQLLYEGEFENRSEERRVGKESGNEKPSDDTQKKSQQ